MLKCFSVILAVTLLVQTVTSEFSGSVGKKSNRVNLLSKAVNARASTGSEADMALLSGPQFQPMTRTSIQGAKVLAFSQPQTIGQQIQQSQFMQPTQQTQFVQPTQQTQFVQPTQQTFSQQRPASSLEQQQLQQQQQQLQQQVQAQQQVQQQKAFQDQQMIQQQQLQQQMQSQQQMQGVRTQQIQPVTTPVVTPVVTPVAAPSMIESQQMQQQQQLQQQQIAAQAQAQQQKAMQDQQMLQQQQQRLMQQQMQQQQMQQQQTRQQTIVQPVQPVVQPVQQFVQPTQQFVQPTQQFVSPIVVPTSNNLCMTANPGDLLPHPSNNVQFIICYGFGEFTVMDCPEHLVYNPHSQRCDLSIEQPQGCASNPCLNNGRCTDMPFFQFRCDCPAGFAGGICEKLDSCASNPCGPGASCISLPQGGPLPNVCSCNGGRTIGVSCASAEPNPCLQQGSNLRLFSVMFNPSLFAHCEGARPNFLFCQAPLIFNAAKQSCDWPAK